MKLWMKALIWAGLGGGIGFFAGYQVGAAMNGRKQASEAPRSRGDTFREEDVVERENAAREALETYRGGDTDGDDAHLADLPDGWENDPMTIDEVEVTRGSAVPEMVPAEIPQLHPENLLPYPITAEEFELNEPEYEQKLLDYYEGDEVLYDPEYSELITVPDEVLGIGALLGFGGDPNNPVETIYIRNDTYGALYQVELVHGRFCDMIPGTFPPAEDNEEDEDERW